MQPSNLLKSGKYKIAIDDVYVSEKLDGMKGRWIGGKLYTRQGNLLACPFADQLPAFDVEGELFFGRGKWHKCGSLKDDSSSRWSEVVFWIFDVVDYNLTFEQRLKKMGNIAITNQVKVVPWTKISGSAVLESYFKQIIDADGEGIVVCQKGGMYIDDRSNSMFKYKGKNDDDAVIVGYNINYMDRLSSLIVKKDDLTFFIGVGFSLEQRKDYKGLFPVGSIITYTYEVLSKSGKPRSPVFKRMILQ